MKKIILTAFKQRSQAYRKIHLLKGTTLNSNSKLYGFSNTREEASASTVDQPYVRTVNAPSSQGVLTVIPTPIGNLSDITPNMMKKLYQADLIGCQDRRVAGQLYKLIKQRKLVDQMIQKFGDFGLGFLSKESALQSYASKYSQSSQMQIDQQLEKQESTQQENERIFMEYQSMSEKQRVRFIRKTFKTAQQEKRFKLDYLKFKSVKIMNQHQEFIYKQSFERRSKSSEFNFDEIYGLESSDLGNIELQIQRTRDKKGRGLLIPLNTYTETKMFDLVRLMLESRKVAIVTDAGMPCISDPGWKIIDHIRTKMPRVRIQVIGGPSSVSIMTFLGNIATSKKFDNKNNRNLSGRFEGFAATEVSKVSEDIVVFNEHQIATKKEDFSIHFINSRKLKKHAIGLQKIYGQNHRIIIASQLTKLFERKYHGTLKQLNQLLTTNQAAFEEGGQMSYILYPPQTENSSPSAQQISQEAKVKKSYIQQNPILSLSVDAFLNALSSTELTDSLRIRNQEKNQLLIAVFDLKLNEAKKKVYEKSKPRRRIADPYQRKYMEQELKMKFDEDFYVIQ